MSVDSEFDIWREQWQSESAVPVDLRRKVERQTRTMRVAFAADVLVTIAIGGGTTAWAVLSGRGDVALLAAATWVFIAAAWAFVFLNLRGAWVPHEATMAEFMAISIRRCRASLRAAVFGAVLCVVEVVFCLDWIYRSDGAGRLEHLDAIAAAGTLVFLGVCVWYRRRQAAELARLLAMQGDAAPERSPVGFQGRRRKVWRRI